jgi:putative PIN family toxin of toxin-antitoxin system
MPPNAVVDASVLVSAFLFPRSVPGRVLTLATDGGFTMTLSPILIEETRRSLMNARLRASYGHDEAAVLAYGVRLARIGTVFSEPLPDIGAVCRDPDDNHVIAAAVASDAAFIVTGDKDLLTLGGFRGIRIVTARDFLDTLANGSGVERS